MSSSSPVRLLILEETQNHAEELIISLRTAGRATRAHLLESEADLTAKLTAQHWDLCLARQEVGNLTIEQIIRKINDLEKDVPVIMLADDQDPASITAGLKMGALDVALEDDEERMILIIERELKNLEHRRMRRKAEVEMRETDRRNQLLLDSSSAAIAYIHEGTHIYTNQSYAELFGYDEPDDFAGIPIIDLIAGEDQAKFKNLLRSYAETLEGTEDFSCMASDGSKVICGLSLSPAAYDGEPCMQMIFKPLADGSEFEDKIREIATQDLLTGLHNRPHFIEHLDTAVNQARDGKGGYVLLYLTVDDFDRVRSEAGISNADLVLADLAAMIRGFVDDKHIMARFGDDEFTILYSEADKAAATELAESLRAKVEAHISDVGGKSFQCTVSTGLALITENTPSAEEIISRAHRACAAIEQGNGVNFFQVQQIKAGEDGQELSTADIQQLLRDALNDNAFQLMFQPIISLHGEDDEQFEVLLRLLDGEGKELMPSQFLGPAEDAGLLEKIDRWVILQSIKLLSAHRAEGSKARLFVNITHKSMSDSTFLPWISVALKAARLPSDTIIFQIHESDASSYIKDATKFCQGLNELHCKTSINHFGCSLNPFNLLKHLTPDYVKLDGSFAQAIEDSEEKQKDLIEMVKSLQSTGVLTAISGVESPSVLSTLFMAGVNFIQGYYISAPLETMDYDFTSEEL